MMERRSFLVFTNYKLLVGALSWWSDPWRACQHHHLSFIAQFSPTICQITGPPNIVADTLLTPAGYFSSLPQPPEDGCFATSSSVAVSSATASPVDLVALATASGGQSYSYSVTNLRN
jgi:hypothetical protein